MIRSREDLRADYPGVSAVLEGCWAYHESDWVDVVQLVDVGLWNAGCDGVSLAACAEQAERFAREVRADEPWRHFQRIGGSDARLFTGHHVDDMQLLALRARHWQARQLPAHEFIDEPPPLPRVSSWADRETAEAAVTEVLRANRAFVEAWAGDPQGLPRIWLSADLGRELGRVMLRAQEPDGEPERVSGGVTRAVVVMARVPEGVFVQTSYPDLPLDPQWPQRFPDLPHVYGAWIGQDWDEEFGSVYYAFELVTRRLAEPARRRVVAQLGELMALPEPDVRAALHAMGSYALPEQCAAWVERLQWALSSWPASVAVDEPLHSRDG